MNSLLTRGSISLLCIVMLQSFCCTRLTWFDIQLHSTLGQSSSYYVSFVCLWAVVTFFARNMGAYILGTYTENYGFLKAQKFLVLGNIFTAVSIYLYLFFLEDFYQTKSIVLAIASLNIFLFPATIITPIIYLMKNHNAATDISISVLVIVASMIGYGISDVCFAWYSPQITGVIVLVASFLAGLIFFLNKNSIIDIKKQGARKINESSLILPGNMAKILATLVGCVCGAAQTYNSFFIEPYLLNVSIVPVGEKLGFISFYAAVGVFLLVAKNIADYITWPRLMFKSLLGMLFVVLSLSFFNIFTAYGPLVYQFLFAFFYAGFLAPSMVLVFSLFEKNKPFFNSTFWFYLGISISYAGGYLLSKQYGLAHSYFLILSPLIISIVACFVALINYSLAATINVFYEKNYLYPKN